MPKAVRLFAEIKTSGPTKFHTTLINRIVNTWDVSGRSDYHNLRQIPNYKELKLQKIRYVHAIDSTVTNEKQLKFFFKVEYKICQSISNRFANIDDEGKTSKTERSKSTHVQYIAQDVVKVT